MNLHSLQSDPPTWELRVIHDGHFCDEGWAEQFCNVRTNPRATPKARAHHFCISGHFGIYPYYCECRACENDPFTHYFNRDAARMADPLARACQPCLDGKHPR